MLGGETALAAITSSVVDGYVKRRLDDGAHRHTVKKELVTLGGILRLAKRRGEFVRDLDVVMLQGFSAGYQPGTQILQPGELERLLAELHAMRAAHVAFIVATGARKGVAERAERADVELALGHVRLRGTNTAKATRVVSVPPALRAYLDWAVRDVPDEAPLFRPWDNLRRELVAAAKRAKVPVVTANDLRRITRRPPLAADSVSNLYGAPLKFDRAVDAVDSRNR